MKILVICQYYYPEPFRISNICEELVRRGHEVLVVTGEPNYPEGKIYEGYENHKRTDEVINGVRIHRCPIIPRKTGSFYRVLNYYSYAYRAKQFIVSGNCTTSDGGKFDVVFVNQLSPVMMAEPAIAYKEKYNVPVVLYCLDLWPESLLAGGIKRNSIPYKFFYSVSRDIYTKMDLILITSKSFKRYFVTKFCIEEKIIDYLPQYAEGLFKKSPVRKGDGTTNLVFAGNVGNVQSVETILCAAEMLINEPVFFQILGSGTDLERLKQLAMVKNLNNLKFYGRRPLEEMPLFYENADAMLITLKADPILSLTVPGKMQSYMAAGKPIIGAIDGEAAEVIKSVECGFVGKAGNAGQLAENIRLFLHSSEKEKLLMGKKARLFYEQNYDKAKFMDKLEKEFKNIQLIN